MAHYVEMRLDEVAIPELFAAHPPKDGKVAGRVSEYKEKGRFRQHMAVTSGGLLVDGYASYLALRELGVEAYKFKTRDEFVVLKACHAGNPGKSYFWKVDKGAAGRFHPGDHIAVHTRYGIREAIVEEVLKMPAEECFSMELVVGGWHPEHSVREPVIKGQGTS